MKKTKLKHNDPADAVLAIDSGGDWAWAYVAGGVLRGCGLRALPDPIPPCTRLVIERPHTGVARASKKDLITLAIRAGEVGGVLRRLTGIEPEYIEPQRWKGSVDKKVMNARVRAKLKPEELAHLVGLSKTKEHNVLDAIGIALYCVQR